MSESFLSFISGRLAENAGALEFVSVLTDTKKSLTAWSEKDIPHRVRVLASLRKYIFDHSAEISKHLSKSQALPESFVLANEVLKSCEIIDDKIKQISQTKTLSSPTGAILILSAARLGFRFQIEIVSSALAAGNVIFIKPSKKDFSSSRIWAEILQSLFQEYPENELPRSLIQVFQGVDEVADLMVSHPSIKAVAFQGKKDTAEKIMELSQTHWKKLMLMSGYHNSALVLPDADLSVAVPKLVESCFLGLGQLRWNMNTILVTESMLPQFEESLKLELDRYSFGHYLKGEEDLATKAMSQVMNEDKKVVWSGNVPGLKVQPVVVKDLSHCSDLQQHCLHAPIVLLSSVKYVHEMAKWANTGYFAQAAQIFGSLEKSQNMAAKLDAGVIFINNWYESLQGPGFGYKQSAYGYNDVSAIGKMFSDAKYLTT